MQLAWSLDRQVPEWFGAVSERLRAPANAILAALVFAGVFALLQNFPILKKSGWASWRRLTGSSTWWPPLWFSILAAGADLDHARRQRAAGPSDPAGPRQGRAVRAWLPLLGAVWLVIMVVLYWFAGLSPIINFVGKLEAESQLDYLNRTGVSFTLLIFAAGLVVFLIAWVRNRARGIDTGLMYRELPPD